MHTVPRIIATRESGLCISKSRNAQEPRLPVAASRLHDSRNCRSRGRLGATGNKLSGTYKISAGPCLGDKGDVTFTRQAGVPTPTPTATPTPTTSPASCAGDCSDLGQVTVEEIVRLASIALGDADLSACPDGIPSGRPVDVVLILQAVNNALKGCPP